MVAPAVSLPGARGTSLRDSHDTNPFLMGIRTRTGGRLADNRRSYRMDWLGARREPARALPAPTMAEADFALGRGPPMEQLWAPWRLAYVANPKPPAASEACF